MSDLQFYTEAGACDITCEVATDLSAKQYCAVKINTSEQAVISGAHEKSVGILQDAPNGSSKVTAGTVRVGGVSLVKLGGSVAAMDFLTPDSSGYLVKAATAGYDFVAKALSSGDSGDLIAAIVCHGEVEGADAS